jgi:hypothetical protein
MFLQSRFEKEKRIWDATGVECATLYQIAFIYSGTVASTVCSSGYQLAWASVAAWALLTWKAASV